MEVKEIEINSEKPIFRVIYRENEEQLETSKWFEQGECKTVAYFENEEDAVNLFWKYRKEIEMAGDSLHAIDESYYWDEDTYELPKYYTARAILAREVPSKVCPFEGHHEVIILKWVYIDCVNEDELKK